MSAIKSKDTKAELALRKQLASSGLRYRLHKKGLPGRPDIVFLTQKLVIFCDGDFWHGRNWELRKKKAFKVRNAYWTNKIERNMARDIRNNRDLRKLGWSVMRLWETDILKNPNAAAKKVMRRLLHLKARGSL